MGDVTSNEILIFLRNLGERYRHPAALFLLGGSALCLLGSPRRTLDIDYTVQASGPGEDELRAAIETIAIEMQLDIEFVSIREFIPLPEDADKRHRPVGQFGTVTVSVFDPYSIALSKLARGFEADLLDVSFLIHQRFVEFGELEKLAKPFASRAAEFDIDPKEFEKNMLTLQRKL